ncbi:hypothetical protein [Acinetobacter marinus]|nr:hypothetical protein [Acinetobacter marinus]
MKKILLTLAMSILATGCATTKITPEARNQLNQMQTKLKQAPVATIVDSCLLHSELGTSLIVGEQSRMTAKKFSEQLRTQLTEQGVAVGQEYTPFVCGFMPEIQLKKYDFKASNEDKRQPISNFPVLNSENAELTPAQKIALLNLNQSINKYQLDVVEALKKKTTATNILNLNDEDVLTLKALTQADQVFLASTTAVDASFGKKFATGALSVGVSLATVGVGAGFYTVIMPKEGQHYALYLVDLNSKELSWQKTMPLKGNLYSKKNHTVIAEKILDPLFEIKAQ